MAPTHVLVGLLLAAPVAVAAPELAPVVALAAVAGSLAPDLDMVVGTHRRTFHFPVLGWLPAVAVAALALSTPGPVPWLVGLAAFLVAAAVHPLCDLLGGSSEPHPWLALTDRGVYSHVGGRWLAPRRLVSYDGSPGDLAVAAGAAVPALFVFGPAVEPFVVAALVVGTGYVLVRRRVPQLSGRIPLPGPVALLLWVVAVVRSR
jgi:hypothetical protein